MNDFLSAIIAAIMLWSMWFPHSAGVQAHNTFNQMVQGWESVK